VKITDRIKKIQIPTKIIYLQVIKITTSHQITTIILATPLRLTRVKIMLARVIWK